MHHHLLYNTSFLARSADHGIQCNKHTIKRLWKLLSRRREPTYQDPSFAYFSGILCTSSLRTNHFLDSQSYQYSERNSRSIPQIMIFRQEEPQNTETCHRKILQLSLLSMTLKGPSHMRHSWRRFKGLICNVGAFLTAASRA